ncbi:MAG: ABC transporter ATP-binding protein [Elusimicrobia bacterium]|nr:ABC transporter ATP-binding protein [Elusimicrobiota bacterium]
MTAAAEPLLRLEEVSKEFRSGGRLLRVLHEVDLSVQAGETLAVTGPSGSGKSTLLAVMAGLDRPSSGRVTFEGAVISDYDEERLAAWRRRHLGFVFQSFRLIASLTALENVALPLELAGSAPEEAARRASELLAALGVDGRGRHLPHQLSGGEQQRVAIARAYIHGPSLILADEPTGSLDRDTAARVLDALFEANARHRTALVVVTHDPAVAARASRSVSL